MQCRTFSLCCIFVVPAVTKDMLVNCSYDSYRLMRENYMASLYWTVISVSSVGLVFCILFSIKTWHGVQWGASRLYTLFTTVETVTHYCVSTVHTPLLTCVGKLTLSILLLKLCQYISQTSWKSRLAIITFIALLYYSNLDLYLNICRHSGILLYPSLKQASGSYSIGLLNCIGKGLQVLICLVKLLASIFLSLESTAPV